MSFALPRRAKSTRRLVAVLAITVGVTTATAFTAPARADDVLTKEFTSKQDTYVSTREPGVPHGERDSAYATGGDTTAFVSFDTSSLIPSGYEVSSVRLRLRVVENQRPNGHPVVRRTTNAWGEDSLTQNNRLWLTEGIVSRETTATAGDWRTIELTTDSLNRWGDSSFEVSFDELYSNFRYSTKNAGAAPRLSVTLKPTGSAPAPISSSPSGGNAPGAAAAAGYSDVAFSDEFDSLESVDMSKTGVAGKKWYTDRTFGMIPAKSSDLAVSNGVLTLNQSNETQNYGIASVSSKSKEGQSFQYGYFEFRAAFDPKNFTKSAGFPSFWSIQRNHVQSPGSVSQWSELNFFEAYHVDYQPYTNMFTGSVHDWIAQSPSNAHRMNVGNNIAYLNDVDFTQMHTYGTLWSPGKIVWYFDGRPLLTQYYGAGQPTPNWGNHPDGTFNNLGKASDGMVLILGTGVDNPMKVDWVRVWQ